MLLPSDVARLVLGYLQQEKLTSTCRSFITESPSLKEYAEHHTEDGSIPGCLLSLFGKNLTTILNEYISMKAKENKGEIPFMMSSLWKKLDLTLSQIRSMQESAAFTNNQRARTRKGINDRLRQRMLTTPLAVSGSPTPQPVIHQTSTPIMATQYILRPLNTPGALPPIACPSFGGESTVQNSSSTSISIVEPAQSTSMVGTQKKPPPAATASPMRRKQDIQRRRRAAQSSSTTGASEGDVGEDVETFQAVLDNGLSQMVIENAREKILSNKSLQEKLAENINKFLGSDSTAKQADGTTAEQDTSIDEILGLQGGEIHMSEEAMHDILAQTELDPDFQELYDLFACVTSKAPKVTTTRESSSSNNDPKSNATEKGKKQEVVERLLDMESGSTEHNKETDVSSKGKEATTLPVQNNEKSMDEQTSQLPSTSNACADEKPSSESTSKSTCGNQNTALIETTHGDMVMDTNTDLLIAEEVVESQGQDTEMRDLSLSKEEAAYGFHMDSLLPDTDKSTGSGSLRTINGDVKDMVSTEAISDGSLQDASESHPVISPTPNVPGTPQKENENQVTKGSTQSPLNKPCNGSTNLQNPNPKENALETVISAEKDQAAQKAAVDIDLAACPGQISVAACPGQTSVAPETETLSSSVPSTSQTVLDDSSIITLNILTEDLPEDAELHNAVQSIDGENYATIILSPLVKSHDLQRVLPSQGNAIIDLTDSPSVGQQAELVTQSSDGAVSLNTLSGDCTIYSISAPSTSTGESGVIQLMPATGTTFAAPGNMYINNCMPHSGPAMQPNIVMLSNSSASNQKQQSLFQTPPRPGSVYTVGQTMSPKLSQGSTIILASPIQPVLQGVMGMLPFSLVGQSGGTFSAPSHQILHVPVSKPIIPKLPLPRAQKPALPKSIVNTGKSSSSSAADTSSASSSSVGQRSVNESKRPESESINKPDVSAVPDSTNVAAKEAEAHRRVLCFDGKTSAAAKSASPSSINTRSQKNDRKDPVHNAGSSSERASSSKASVSKESKKSEGIPPSGVKNLKASTTSAATKEQAAEKRPAAPSGGTLGNKENLLQVETGNPGAANADKRSNTPESEKNGKRPQEASKKSPSLPNILRKTPQKVPPERVCPTSPLVKQASQLLQGMQFQSPVSKQSSQGDIPIPPTPGSGLEDKPLDNHVEQTRTPTSKRYNDDGGTPKPMLPPATPDLPTCSPASEAGSENSVSSVNMAAHTLMILSRATLAKSSGNTPLKDNTQQIKSSKSSSKKRKLDETEGFERPSHKKDHISPATSQKKRRAKKQRKKSMDNFPAGMDVDKFLMSLHYDE